MLLTPFELRHVAERSLGLSAGALTWQGPFDPSTDELWQRFQAGELTERDYWAGRAGEHHLDTRGFMRHFYEPGGDHLVRTEVVELVERAKRDGRRVGVLTNDLEAFHGTAWMSTITLLSQVDALVDGSITGILKPDQRSYAAALDALGVGPDEVVFVDDQPINIEGARVAGLCAVSFDVTRPTTSVRQIADALGL